MLPGTYLLKSQETETDKLLIQGTAPKKNLAYEMLKGDKVDQELNYLSSPSETLLEKQAKFAKFLNDQVFNMKLPKGYVVELGVWKCDTYKLFEKQYGPQRCKGYDIYNYTNRKDLHIEDVRKISQKESYPIALGRNHASSWQDSFMSRYAGLEFLVKNTVVGGFILEASLDMIPKNVAIYGFEHHLSYKKVSILKKVSPNSYCKTIA